ncbi:UNC5A-like protein [Mya arenaria]|uniref:UNC5A-like protein n=1 Tax=Mya arenaria TaxID=6604 RepID=A0ABY7FVT5_MYAAR|nr:UNC5A-like protein [Mya arenaria]
MESALYCQIHVKEIALSREAGRTGKAGEYVAVTTSATGREHVTILHLKITAPFVKDSRTNLKAVFEEVMTSVRCTAVGLCGWTPQIALPHAELLTKHNPVLVPILRHTMAEKTVSGHLNGMLNALMFFVLFELDGGWSYWTEWTQCSVTCDGQGTQSRNRSCDNPHPLFGGAKCQGDEYAMRDCRSPDKCASRLVKANAMSKLFRTNY